MHPPTTSHEPAQKPTPAPIHPALLTLHWLMAGLFVLALGSLLIRGWLPSGHGARPVLRNVHLTCGQLILLAAVLRVLVRWRHPPAPVGGVPAWASRMGHGAHALLYGVMFVQPLSAIVFMQAGDKTVQLFGWALPRLVGPDIAVQADFKAFHQTLGTSIYALLALHVGAALWHHHGLRNDTLRRMLGRRRKTVVTVTTAPPLALPEPAAIGHGRPPSALPQAAALQRPKPARTAARDAEAID